MHAICSIRRLVGSLKLRRGFLLSSLLPAVCANVVQVLVRRALNYLFFFFPHVMLVSDVF